jgi:hypothetical protein
MLVLVHLHINIMCSTVDLEIRALTAALCALQHAIMDKGESRGSKEILHTVLFGVTSNLDDVRVTGPTFPVGQDVI